MIEINNVTIRKKLFRNFNWKINKGESWIAKGSNGHRGEFNYSFISGGKNAISSENKKNLLSTS